MKLKPLFSALALVVICLVTAGADKCPSGQSVKGVSKGVYAGAEFYKDEVEQDVRDGALSEADGQRLRNYAHEVGSSARVLYQTAESWTAMTPAQKRAASVRFAREVAGAQERLNAGGAPVIKSEKARRHYAEFMKWLRRAETFMRAFDGPLPTPSATPAESRGLPPGAARMKGRIVRAAYQPNTSPAAVFRTS